MSLPGQRALVAVAEVVTQKDSSRERINSSSGNPIEQWCSFEMPVVL